VVCRSGEIIARTFYRVGVTVPFRARHAHGTRREEFLHRHTMPVDGNAVALGLGNLQQIHAHAGEADGLRGRGALVRGGHALEVENIDAEKKSHEDEHGDEGLHEEIVTPARRAGNSAVRTRAEGNNSALFLPALTPGLLDSQLSPNPRERFPLD
jgi:hypothetical protein